MSRSPLIVAFTFIPRRLHAGGFNYLRNLFVALHRYHPGELQPVMFAGLSDDDDELTAFTEIPGVKVVKNRAFERDHSGLPSALLAGVDFAAAAAFRSANVDVVFEHARFFGWRLPFPVAAWFPDLQHRSLPHLFTRAARWRREIGFRAQLASGRSIVLSSESALNDCKRFYPRSRNQMSVVRFASRPTDDLLSVDPREVACLYQLPEQYFYLPNQFWRHKNHQLVLDAMTILARRGIKPVVVISIRRSRRTACLLQQYHARSRAARAQGRLSLHWNDPTRACLCAAPFVSGAYQPFSVRRLEHDGGRSEVV
ncbi:hypothetical protein ACVW0W_005166 [Bradyrhizobium sp. USDA 4469]